MMKATETRFVEDIENMLTVGPINPEQMADEVAKEHETATGDDVVCPINLQKCRSDCPWWMEWSYKYTRDQGCAVRFIAEAAIRLAQFWGENED